MAELADRAQSGARRKRHAAGHAAGRVDGRRRWSQFATVTKNLNDIVGDEQFKAQLKDGPHRNCRR